MKVFLHQGWLGRWWLQYRTRRIENRYLAIISKDVDHEPNLLEIRSPHKMPLRRILFIGDVMWEKSHLFPELYRIAKLDVLNLHESLDGEASGDPATVTLRAIDEYEPEASPDLIFFYARPSLLSESVFELLRHKWKCPILGMNLDDRVEYHDGIRRKDLPGYCRWAKKFDLNITSCKLAEEWYRADGAAVRFMTQGFARHADYSQPPNSLDFRYPLSFVGALKPERSALMEILEDYGIHVAVFGNGWDKSGWLDNPVDLYRSSQLNLGISAILASGNITCLKGRDIECPATGACYLTSYHWELPDLFEIGKEILCYRNPAELMEMYSFYSKRPELCLKIAQAAHKRAHSEHTWEQRLRAIFHEMDFAI